MILVACLSVMWQVVRESDLGRVGGLGLGLGCRQAKYVPIVEARKEKARVAWGREGSGGSMVGDFMIALWGFGCFGFAGFNDS